MTISAAAAATNVSNTGARTSGAGAAAQGAAQNAQGRIANDFGAFLKLLTTQLQNQDPTNPLDTNQFTNQLVQFASVEQQIAMNQNLGQLIGLEQTAQLTASAPLMGRRIEVESDQIPLVNGAAEIKLAAADRARQARVAVVDSQGRTVREQVVALGSQPTSWTWDGRSSTGQRQPDGAYRVAVNGVAVDGSRADAPFTVIGTATATERQGNSLRLALGPVTVGFDKVRSVVAHSPAPGLTAP